MWFSLKSGFGAFLSLLKSAVGQLAQKSSKTAKRGSIQMLFLPDGKKSLDFKNEDTVGGSSFVVFAAATKF